MNFPVSRFPESAQPSHQTSSKDEATSPTLTPSSEPIPAPNHPRQYRAIGLIEGKYQPKPEKMTCGEFTTAKGIKIEAVLLGRMISLIKNHIDLDKNHLWVVYPRVNQKTEQLHLQLVGIWEPETLAKEATSLSSEDHLSSPIEDGFFSIRGEVVYASDEKKTVIVKIVQSPRKKEDRPKSFKLKLQGTLPNRPVGHFWDLKVKLEQTKLIVQDGEDLGLVSPRKPFKKGTKPQKPFKKDSKIPQYLQGRSSNPEKPTLRPPSSVGKPTLPKPFTGKPKNQE